MLDISPGTNTNTIRRFHLPCLGIVWLSCSIFAAVIQTTGGSPTPARPPGGSIHPPLPPSLTLIVSWLLLSGQISCLVGKGQIFGSNKKSSRIKMCANEGFWKRLHRSVFTNKAYFELLKNRDQARYIANCFQVPLADCICNILRILLYCIQKRR